MCNCKNEEFKVVDNQLYVWHDEYDDFHPLSISCYKYCPICGEDLQPEGKILNNKKKHIKNPFLDEIRECYIRREEE